MRVPAVVLYYKVSLPLESLIAHFMQCGPGRQTDWKYDITFAVFRNEQGSVEFALQVIRDAKDMIQTLDKRFVLDTLPLF